MNNYFLIAEIQSAFDADGFVKIKSYSDFPERFFYLEKVFINIFGDYREFIVEDVEQFEDYFLLKFQNFNSESDVEFLVGASVFVEKNDAVHLDDDTFFIHDLIGCEVFFADKFFGKIVDVMSLVSNDVYVVVDENERERLIPALSDFIESVDVESKKIFLNLDFDDVSDDEN